MVEIVSQTNQETIVDLKNIVVSFQNQNKTVKAVDNVNLSVQRADIYGVVGYSGAGKSTLLRVINLLQRPTSGTVLVGGQDMQQIDDKSLRQRRKKIGMIFQHFNLMNARTVLSNVSFPLLDSHLRKKEREKKALDLLGLVGLSDYSSVYPAQLSGGQKQRVAIARALANDPEILISDEATSALDPKTTESILDLLKELNEKLHLTIILITHEMDVIKGICRHVAVMDAGRIIERGSVADIFVQPKESLTQDFVDSSTNIKRALARILKNRQTRSDEQLLYLRFIGESANDDTISEMMKSSDIHLNILFANIDQVSGQDIGQMIAAISGNNRARSEALLMLQSKGVQVRVLNQDQGRLS